MSGTIERVDVDAASRPYEVLVGEGLLEQLGLLISELGHVGRCCVITETNVGPLYADIVESALRSSGLEIAPRVTFVAGESSKTLDTLGGILEALAECALTRDDTIVALGGGVTGDMGGLAAALYLRGIRVVQVPTSLLAMVDSSVGGKTAVDLATGKNLVGAFWQPSLVVADVNTLATVPPALFRDSCGEVIKHTVLADSELLDELTIRPLTEEREPTRLAMVVAQNVAIKRNVVIADECEMGLRQTLNLGHTIGHAIEAASNFSLGHGSCVAAGLCMMARASERRGWCSPETAARIIRCVNAHGLPTGTDLPAEELMRYAAHDKKRHGNRVNIVIPCEVGHCEVRCVSMSELRELIKLGL